MQAPTTPRNTPCTCIYSPYRDRPRRAIKLETLKEEESVRELEVSTHKICPKSVTIIDVAEEIRDKRRERKERITAEAKDLITKVKRADYRPTSQPLQCIRPNIYGPHLDITKAKVAFGRWALPKLREELRQNSNLLVKQQAINSLVDILENPERSVEAIRLGLVEVIRDQLTDPDPIIRERCCMCLRTIAGLAEGREAIIKTNTISPLANRIDDRCIPVAYKALLALEMVGRTWIGANGLVAAGLIEIILRRVEYNIEELQAVMLEVLHFCLERENVSATYMHGLQIFTRLLRHPLADVRAGAATCIADLCVNPKGKILASQLDLLKYLLVHLADPIREVRAKVAAAVMFITHTTPAKLRSVQLNLMDPLVDLSRDSYSIELQFNAIRALTNIAEVPKARMHLRKFHLATIRDINTSFSIHLDRMKQDLIRVITWDP